MRGSPRYRGGEQQALPILTPGSGATIGKVRGRPSWSSTAKVMKALLMCLRLPDISWPYASAQTPTSMLDGSRERRRGEGAESCWEVGMGIPRHQHPPVFEGIVDDGFEHQAVPDLRWSAEVEHLNGLQRGVGMAQPAVEGRRYPLAMATCPSSLAHPP